MTKITGKHTNLLLGIKKIWQSDRGRTATVVETTSNKNNRKNSNMTLLPIMAALEGSIHVGLAALGSAIGVGFVGAKAAEATGRNPGASTQIMVISIILAALAEGITFFAIFLA